MFLTRTKSSSTGPVIYERSKKLFSIVKTTFLPIHFPTTNLRVISSTYDGQNRVGSTFALKTTTFNLAIKSKSGLMKTELTFHITRSPILTNLALPVF